MRPKKLRTLLHLLAWPVPAGIRVFYAVAPDTKKIRAVLMGATGDMVLLFSPSWSCRHYHATLASSARELSDLDQLALALDPAEAIKEAMRRKVDPS